LTLGEILAVVFFGHSPGGWTYRGPVATIKGGASLRISRLFWAGLILLAIGLTPLLAVMLFSRDPNPNPIGFSLLAFVTFWPAIVMIVIGWNRSYR